MKSAITLFIVILITTLLMHVLSIPEAYAVDAAVVVDPATYEATLGEVFNLTFRVQDVINLHSWQLELFFDPTVLTCTNYTIPLENILGTTIISPPPIINNTLGKVFAFVARDTAAGVNGSGILCRIEFQAVVPGISFIDIRKEATFEGTYLADPAIGLIPFTATDGTVKTTAPNFSENTYQVTVNATPYTVIVYSNSTIANFGYSTDQTVNYTATAADETKGQTTNIIPKILLHPPPATLIDSSATYCTFSENATHIFIHFTYNHSERGITILSTILYDVNGDRRVNMLDLYLVALRYGTIPGHPNWDPLKDVDYNGIINMLDLYRVAIHFGEVWTP